MVIKYTAKITLLLQTTKQQQRKDNTFVIFLFSGRGRRSHGRSGAAEGIATGVVVWRCDGAGHICPASWGWCAGGLRSVAAAFACEMGVFCGEVRLKISVLWVFLAVEWGSKRERCEDLLIFFRNRACLSVGFAYITREEGTISTM